MFGAKELSEPMQAYYKIDREEHFKITFYLKINGLHSRKYIWISRLQNGRPFCLDRNL